MLIDRAFVRLDEGLVHLRRVAGRVPDAPPLVLLHLSPLSSASLEPLIAELYAQGYPGEIVAPDTLGNGDSAPPAPEQPEIAYFADSLKRLMDALGHDRINLYGSHTGARIACEFTVAYPGRVVRTALSGITDYTDALRDSILAHYAPPIEPDEYGRQFIWAFNFIRDQAFYFPYFMRDPEHRLAVSVWSPAQLHAATIDIAKALGTYQKPYLAAFRYCASARLKLISTPTILLNPAEALPRLRAAAVELAALSPHTATVETTGGDAGVARAMLDFMRDAT
jgi:pimeloyl-ACP methyl ester carboxylesterase